MSSIVPLFCCPRAGDLAQLSLSHLAFEDQIPLCHVPFLGVLNLIKGTGLSLVLLWFLGLESELPSCLSTAVVATVLHVCSCHNRGCLSAHAHNDGLLQLLGLGLNPGSYALLSFQSRQWRRRRDATTLSCWQWPSCLALQLCIACSHG